MRAKAVGQVALAVGLIGVAVCLFARHFTVTHSSKQVPVRCVSCGYEYVPKQAELDPECPKCHAKGGLQLLYFRCTQCGATFIAYEEDPRRELIREPGGLWMPIRECALQPVCPKCSSPDPVFVRPGQARTGTSERAVPSEDQGG